jgi:hypothetical protein
MMRKDTIPKCEEVWGIARLQVLLTVLVVAVYGAAAFIQYAYSDDYGQMLYIKERWVNWSSDFLTRDGRPITSALLCWSFDLVGTLGNLRFLRVLSVLFVVLLALHVFRSSVSIGTRRWTAFAYALLVALAPGIGEIVGWTVCWPYALTMLMTSLLGAWYARRAATDTRYASIAVCGLTAVVALQFVMLTYQPTAGVFIFIPLLWLLEGKSIRPSVLGSAVLAVSFLVYRFGVFPALHALNAAWCQPTRTGIAGNLPAHMLAVLTDSLPTYAASWTVLLAGRNVCLIIGIAVLILSVVGCAVAVLEYKGQTRFAVVPVIASVFALSAPQVFLMDDSYAFRISYAMTTVMLLLAWKAISWFRPASTTWLVGAATAVFVLCAAWCFNVGIVHSSAREYNIVRSELEQLKRTGSRHACALIMPARYSFQAPVPIRYHSAYATVSLTVMHRFEIDAVAREVWPDSSVRPVFDYVPADATSAIPADGTPVLDIWGKISRQR